MCPSPLNAEESTCTSKAGRRTDQRNWAPCSAVHAGRETTGRCQVPRCSLSPRKTYWLRNGGRGSLKRESNGSSALSCPQRNLNTGMETLNCGCRRLHSHWLCRQGFKIARTWKSEKNFPLLNPIGIFKSFGVSLVPPRGHFLCFPRSFLSLFGKRGPHGPICIWLLCRVSPVLPTTG